MEDQISHLCRKAWPCKITLTRNLSSHASKMYLRSHPAVCSCFSCHYPRLSLYSSNSKISNLYNLSTKLIDFRTSKSFENYSENASDTTRMNNKPKQWIISSACVTWKFVKKKLKDNEKVNSSWIKKFI